MQRLLALVDMRLAVVTEEKANYETRFRELGELRRQVSKFDLGGRKKSRARLESNQVRQQTAA